MLGVPDENFIDAYQNTLSPAAFQWVELHRLAEVEANDPKNPAKTLLQGMYDKLAASDAGREVLAHLQQEAAMIEDPKNGLITTQW
jgi:hypothetical protein